MNVQENHLPEVVWWEFVVEVHLEVVEVSCEVVAEVN